MDVKKPYVIVRAGTLDRLETLVNIALIEGYSPIGGPIITSVLTPEMGVSVSQAMIVKTPVHDVAPVAPKPKRATPSKA